MKKRVKIRQAALLLSILLLVVVLAVFVFASELYTDVAPNAWYSEYVYEATERDLFNGIGNHLFGPEGNMTRAMLVTVLWRMEGEPEGGPTAFKDVPAGTYYYDAVRWAKSENIVNGMDAEHFGPDLSVTREQMVTILARYAKGKGYGLESSELTGCADIASVSGYAETSVRWAVSNGLLRCEKGLIRPKDAATRAEVAACFVCSLNHWGVESPSVEGPGEIGGVEKPAGEAGTEDNAGVGEMDNTEKPAFVVSNVTAKPGDSGVEIVVSMKNSPGVTAVLLDVEFDDKNLHFKSIEYNRKMGGDVVRPQNGNSPLCIFWVEGLTDLHGDWVVATLKFDVDRDAANGNYDISLSYDADNVFNFLEENVAFEIINGKICVESQ